jgi:polyisoprenoid-binding protein YceI
VAAGPRRTPATRLEIAPGTKASYRVREQLLGFNFPNDAVGTTQTVSGSITIAPDGAVAGGSKITVDLRTLKSDDERRDNYLRDRMLQASESPHAEFVARRLTGTPLPIPTSGKATLQLVGDMTVHRTTAEITWTIDATFSPDRVTGQARTNFPFAKFGLVIPRLPGLLSVDDNIKLELDLVLRRSDAS